MQCCFCLVTGQNNVSILGCAACENIFLQSLGEIMCGLTCTSFNKYQICIIVPMVLCTVTCVSVKQRRNWHRHDYSDSGASKVISLLSFRSLPQ